MKKEIGKLIESRGLEVKVEDVVKVMDKVKGGYFSKSKGICELYEMGFFVGDVNRIFGSCGVKMIYNMVYNVLSEKGYEIRKEKKKDGDSKSGLIRKLFREGKSEREIGEEFVKRGEYVNSNMIYSICRKEKKKRGDVEKV